MSDIHSRPISIPSPAHTHQRRVSVSQELSLTDPFSRAANAAVSSTNPSFPNSIATAAANAQSTRPRRPSVSTLGLSGSPTQSSPFATASSPFLRPAGLPGSGSGSGSGPPSSANTEDAVDDSENVSASFDSPLAQRTQRQRASSGAQSRRDGSRASMSKGKASIPSPGSPPPVAEKRRTSLASSGPAAAGASANKGFPQNDLSQISRRRMSGGFDWSEALRTRAERAPSLTAMAPTVAPPQQQSNDAGIGKHGGHQRAASIALLEQQPVRNVPKEPRSKKPDYFQEKILRGGDFID